MEFQFPGQESQEILSEGHGKSWKGNMFGNKIFQFKIEKKKITDESVTALISAAKVTSTHLSCAL